MSQAAAIPVDPHLALALRAARPWPIERFVKGSLTAAVDGGLGEAVYAYYLGQWMARNVTTPDAPFAAAFAWLRTWRYAAFVKTGRWPKDRP